MCACCAPHVSRTGEVGIIKVISCDRHRGGCRMTIQCGDRALEDYRKKQEGCDRSVCSSVSTAGEGRGCGSSYERADGPDPHEA